MNLYTQASANTRKTWLYLTMFLLVVMGVGWAVSILAGNFFILVIAVVLAAVMGISSYWYSDKLVLKMSHATEIEKKDHAELYRIVENLCITAGLPMPKLYIVQDAQPNAFATGRDAKHGVVAVTTGLLERLDRVELEAVIAHEISHIGNKDMLVSTMSVVLVGVIMIVADFFFHMVFWGGIGRNNDRGGGQLQIILLVVAVVFLILSPFLAQMLKFAISRKREFLADASGALLTRHPDALATALEKIAAHPTQLKTAGDATAHLYFASPFRGKEKDSWIHKLFMTHPPVQERIQALRSMNNI